mmetsp:Transcript_10642/g.22448  ORF Transcript_10642/g.22448 Transcript_10642/m.22448 type:complete len:311 (-) Transcript_10642:2073-3005(-)
MDGSLAAFALVPWRLVLLPLVPGVGFVGAPVVGDRSSVFAVQANWSYGSVKNKQILCGSDTGSILVAAVIKVEAVVVDEETFPSRACFHLSQLFSFFLEMQSILDRVLDTSKNILIRNRCSRGGVFLSCRPSAFGSWIHRRCCGRRCCGRRCCWFGGFGRRGPSWRRAPSGLFLGTILFQKINSVSKGRSVAQQPNLVIVEVVAVGAVFVFFRLDAQDEPTIGRCKNSNFVSCGTRQTGQLAKSNDRSGIEIVAHRSSSPIGNLQPRRVPGISLGPCKTIFWYSAGLCLFAAADTTWGLLATNRIIIVGL